MEYNIGNLVIHNPNRDNTILARIIGIEDNKFILQSCKGCYTYVQNRYIEVEPSQVVEVKSEKDIKVFMDNLINIEKDNESKISEDKYLERENEIKVDIIKKINDLSRMNYELNDMEEIGSIYKEIVLIKTYLDNLGYKIKTRKRDEKYDRETIKIKIARLKEEKKNLLDVFKSIKR